MAPRLDSPFLRALRDVVGSTRLTADVIETVAQQQLVHGGTLDTLLLEAGVVDEPAVAAALSAANGTAPVDPTILAAPAPEALRRLPARMATTMGLLPLFLGDGGAPGVPAALHVACCGPVDRGLCAEVGGLIGVAIVAHAVPEVRVRVGLHRACGAPLNERFAALLRVLDGAAAPSSQPASPASPASSAPAGSATQPTSTTTAAMSTAGLSSPVSAPSPTLPPQAAGNDDESPPADWDLAEALAHLAAQDGREGIARVATTFARRFVPFAALVGVRDGVLVGWRRSGPAEGVAFSSRPFVLPSEAFIVPVLASTSPYLGRVPPGEANDALLGWLGRRRPRTVLVAPVHVAGRVVAALWADADVRVREPRELGELAAFSARLGNAFEALLRQRQRQHPSLFPTATTALVAPAHGMPAGPAAAPMARASADAVPTDGAAAVPDAPPDWTVAPPSVVAAAAPGDARVVASADSAPAATDEPLVIATAGAALLDGALPLRARGDDASEAQVPALFQVDETAAPGAWQAALRRTVEQGLQGGSVDEADDWEDVAWEPAHGLMKRSAALNFTALSASTLAGIDPDDEPATIARGATTANVDGEGEGGAAAAAAIAQTALDARRHGNDADGARDERAGLAGFATRDGDGAGDDSDGQDAISGAGTAAATGLAEPLASLSSHALVEQLLGDDHAVIARALRLLVARGPAAVPALAERFPGRLRVDPFDPGHNVQTPAALGPLVDALAQLGKPGLDAALPHLDSRHPAHRFSAVLLFVATHDVRAIELLRARLYDAEPRIRALAVDAIQPWMAHKRFEPLLVHLRERVVTERLVPTESRRRAVELLGTFRDVGAVPLLVAQLGGPLGDTARTALRAVTLQDHGARPRAWEKWWAKAKKLSRIDWLIEGLGSEELELRRAAHTELRTVTGDDFGYRPDAERRVRQRAVVVWQQWWSDERKQAEEAAR